MSAVRITRSRFRRPGPKRETSWLALPLLTTTFAPNVSAAIYSLVTADQARRPFTIVRIHLTVFITSDQAAAEERYELAIGACVVSDQAQAAGIAALPTPFTEIGSDFWMLHKVMMSTFLFLTAIGVEEPAGQYAEIDSKAMRKVNDAEDFLVIAESGAGGGVTATFAGRMLIKEN